MSKKHVGQIVIFCLYTYLIANSILFALGLVLIDRFSLSYCWKKFTFLFCQWNLLNIFFCGPWDFGIVIILFIFLYEAVLFYFPVLFWWRKRTIFRAWIVAMTGLLLPNYLITFIARKQDDDGIFLPGALVMTAGYALAWLISFCHEKFRQPLRPVLSATNYPGGDICKDTPNNS